MLDEAWGVCYYNTRFVGQAVKTPPSHGGNTGSIPVRTATIINIIAQPERMLSYDSIFFTSSVFMEPLGFVETLDFFIIAVTFLMGSTEK